MKSALFVDLDNVYSGLRRLDPAAADRFGLRPLDWIRWLMQSLPAPPHAPAGAARRLLVRRCYLNPQVYQRFRPAFNRASLGFDEPEPAAPPSIPVGRAARPPLTAHSAATAATEYSPAGKLLSAP